MKRSTERILTTHTGSLARPKELAETMRAKLNGQPYDRAGYDQSVRSAVADVVRKQVDSGIDVVTDGEQGKAGFFTYVRDRLTGFEAAAEPPRGRGMQWAKEIAAFPEYYERYFGSNMRGIAPNVALVCTGPVSYKGQDAVKADIDNLKAALAGMAPEDVFMPATRPASSAATSTTARWRSSWRRSPRRCGPSTRRSSTRASSSRWTIRPSPTSTARTHP